ncbi:MAG: zinc ABC transporter substrate-binding protein [Phycisphaerales bacterium]|nr:zinc ABC transporter substrate-binding protein [Phycisphaerales bacterium]
MTHRSSSRNLGRFTGPAGPLLGLALAVLVVCFAALVGSCGQAPAPQNGRLLVVSTTGMINDVVRSIGGERVDARALMGEGVDPHLYKATPGDVRLLSGAAVVFYNGLHLEGRMGDVLENLASRRPVVAVAEAIDPARLRSPPEFEGHPDPHVWFDVELWSDVARTVRDALVKIDPAGKDAYAAAAEQYLARLDELHTWCREQIQRIPEPSRLLITAHDAFGYFGRAYGLEVMGIQGISTDSEASLRDIAHLVDILVERKVPAVFVESSVPRKTIDALVEGCKARGHAVAIGGELFSDAMGPDGGETGTYIGMVRHNVNTIVHALAPGGGATSPASEGAPSGAPDAQPAGTAR